MIVTAVNGDMPFAPFVWQVIDNLLGHRDISRKPQDEFVKVEGRDYISALAAKTPS